MFKNVIAPLQVWLLRIGKCVGCGKDLTKPKGRRNEVQVSCFCRRVYMFDPETNSFRRAKVHEV